MNVGFGLALTAIVFVLVAVVLLIASSDAYGQMTNRSVRSMSAASFGLAMTLFIAAIWTGVAGA